MAFWSIDSGGANGSLGLDSVHHGFGGSIGLHLYFLAMTRLKKIENARRLD
jgi:hypothetical protein